VSLATAPFTAALAQTAQNKATARELAKQGIAAEQKGDCDVAIDKLERAEELFHAPPHLRYLARCYTKVGRLVDAAEAWRKLTHEQLPANAPPVFKEAVAEAQTELPKIEPRLAHLTLKTDQKYEDLRVEVDGKAWPSAALDISRVIDPGKHVIRAKATGYKTTEQSIEVDEGKSDSVTLTLEPGSDPGDVPPVPTATATTTATSAPTTTAPPPGRSGLATVGWVTVTIGVLAVGGGVYTGLTANRKYRDLDRDCPDRSNCSAVPDLEQRKDGIRTLGTATNILLIGGGILAVAGISMVLFAPSRKDSSPAMSLQFSPTVAGGHVAVTGSF
jgi:hypothetical protein